MGKATFHGCISLHIEIFSTISRRVLLSKFWGKKDFSMSVFQPIFRCVVTSPIAPLEPLPVPCWLVGNHRERGWAKAHRCPRVPCPNTGHAHLLNVITCRKAKHRPRRKCIQCLEKNNKPSKFMGQTRKIYRKGFAARALIWMREKVFVRVLTPTWCGSGWAWLVFSIISRFGLYSPATAMKSILEIAYT